MYVKEFILFSEDPEEHIKHVDIALKALKEARLSPKINKYKFFKNKLRYLGHIVRSGTFDVDQFSISHYYKRYLRKLRHR